MKHAIWIAVAVLGAKAIPASATEGLAGQARAILKSHCARCHSPGGSAKGGFDFVLHRDALVARKKVVPRQAQASELFQRIRKGTMPPRKEKRRPTAAELAVLEQWINAGAPSWETARPTTPIITESDITAAILRDLTGLPELERRFYRYFTVANLLNAATSEAEIAACRLGLAKLLNSLSWHPRLYMPDAIDQHGAVLRIDLRHYKWNARLWNRLAAVYPYRTENESESARRIAQWTNSEQVFLRADWFVASASRAPLYYDLLLLPSNDRGLERLLQVDAAVDIEELSVARSGFNSSGVSKNNRLIERHDAGFGAYWKTYDFAENVDKQNLFNHPLGPPPGRDSFVHSGGEMIFHLPNGLLGFFVTDGVGRRIERAPVEIVSDPQRPDRIVEAGISCFRCHAAGMIPKADQVRAHVLKNPAPFAKEDIERVKALFPPVPSFRRLLDEDNRRFHQALSALKVKPDGIEPITRTTQYYEGVVDLTAAASELGLSPVEFAARLGKDAAMSRRLGALRAAGGTVQRDLFADVFDELADAIGFGSSPARAVAGSEFTGHTQSILDIAISADGEQAATGSADRTLRLWDMAGGKELARFKHFESVTAVAFSPDGKQVVSASSDRRVRLWDIDTGKEVQVFEGHTDAVSCVSLSADGRLILSGSSDRTMRLWNARTGKEVRAFTGHAGKVSAVAFSADGKHVLSGSLDRTVRLWRIKNGSMAREFKEPAGEIHSVAFSPDGKWIAAGGNNGILRLWSVKKRKEVRKLEGHANAVVRVAFSKDGRRLLSGSSKYQNDDRTVRVWNVQTGKETWSTSTGRVSRMAFGPDGKKALIDGPGTQLKLIRLP